MDWREQELSPEASREAWQLTVAGVTAFAHILQLNSKLTYPLQGGNLRISDTFLLQGKPGPWNYDPEEVRAVLEKLHS